MIEEAIFIKRTRSGKTDDLDRWECPICRRNKEPECRFNLKSQKRGQFHTCRFCKNIIKIPELKNEDKT